MQVDGRTVLVTGAGGFIGSHLVRALLERECQVKAFVRYNSRGTWGHLDSLTRLERERVQVILGDIRDESLVRDATRGSDIVFHLAALIGIPYSYHAVSSYIETNVVGTSNVLAACRYHGVSRVIHTSTSEVYGTAQYTPIDERHPLQAQSPYAATKVAADKLAEAYYRSFDLPVATIRPFNTYGPRQSARAVIPAIITQALTRDTIELGDLTPVRDFTFVADTVRAFILVAESDEAIGQVINIGSGSAVSIGDLATAVLTLTGRHGTCRISRDAKRLRPPQSEVRALLCDGTRARELLRWQPSVSLEEGLQRTIDYVRAHISEYRPGAYCI